MIPSPVRASARLALESVLLIAGSGLAMQSAIAAPPDVTPVPVTISGPLPVPVSGSTSISGPVSVSGTVSVRDVDNAGRSPFQARLCTAASFGGSFTSCGSTTNVFQAPSNRRTVIEYVSGDCARSGDITSFSITLVTTAGGTSASYVVRYALNPIDGRFLEAGQLVRIYADPATTVGLGSSISSGASAGSLNCTVTLSGYTLAL